MEQTIKPFSFEKKDRNFGKKFTEVMVVYKYRKHVVLAWRPQLPETTPSLLRIAPTAGRTSGASVFLGS